MLLLSKEDARSQGLKWYFTGQPCLRGHVAPRQVSNGRCRTCHQTSKALPENKRRDKQTRQSNRTAERREQERRKALERRRANPEKYRERDRRRDPVKRAESKKRSYLKNKEKHRAREAVRRERDREKIAQYQQEYRQKNLEKSRSKTREWNRRNIKRKIAHNIARRKRTRQATPPWVRKFDLAAVIELCPEGMHVDHEIPLKNRAVCGLHVPWNLVFTDPQINRIKHNYFDPAEWHWCDVIRGFVRVVGPNAPDKVEDL